MKLLLRRSQRQGLLGKVTFSLEVRAQLTPEEQENVKKYKLGGGLLYERNAMKEGGSEVRQLGNALVHRFLNLTISVNDLATGKTIECKDIGEMLAAEEQVKEAAHIFKAILHAASTFDGEEVIEI